MKFFGVSFWVSFFCTLLGWVTGGCQCPTDREMICRDEISPLLDYGKCASVKRIVFADLAEGGDTRDAVCTVDFPGLFPNLRRIVLDPGEESCACLPCFKNVDTDGCSCESIQK